MVSKRAQINQVAASKSCYWQTLLSKGALTFQYWIGLGMRKKVENLF